jgi:hypothetical protein
MNRFLILNIDSSRGEIIDEMYEEGSELNFKDFCNELYRKVKVKKDEEGVEGVYFIDEYCEVVVDEDERYEVYERIVK